MQDINLCARLCTLLNRVQRQWVESPQQRFLKKNLLANTGRDKHRPTINGNQAVVDWAVFCHKRVKGPMMMKWERWIKGHDEGQNQEIIVWEARLPNICLPPPAADVSPPSIVDHLNWFGMKDKEGNID